MLLERGRLLERLLPAGLEYEQIREIVIVMEAALRQAGLQDFERRPETVQDLLRAGTIDTV